MAYDKEKDKIVKEWRRKISSERELSITLRSYDGKPAKLQIGPYIRIDKDGNDIGVWGRLGRMDLADAEIVLEYLPRVLKFMTKLEGKKDDK